MNFNVLHRRLMQDVLEIGNNSPLVITGGYAASLPRDLIDIHAASQLCSNIELESLADVTPGMSNSASMSSRHVLRVPNGTTTKRSPNMDLPRPTRKTTANRSERCRSAGSLTALLRHIPVRGRMRRPG